MKKWSTYFQNPDYLEYTRKFFLPEDIKPLLVKYYRIRDGAVVLDVGCGTGYFSRLLAKHSNARVTGLDIDSDFIRAANRLRNEENLDNLIFVEGDACKLPFEDGRFDAVVSHTFFHSVPDPVSAMKEMKRVCKSYGTIGALAPFDLTFFPSTPGHYPAECVWRERLKALEAKKYAMYERVAPVFGYLNQLPPAELPYFFHKAGLADVSVYPVGQAFSLSNHALPAEEKAAYVRLMYAAEMAKLDAFMALPENAFFTAGDYEEYKTLYQQQTDYWLANIRENGVWEMRAGCFMVVTGVAPLNLNIFSSESGGVEDA